MMGVIKRLKEEIAVIRQRDPAIHTAMEVFLYPSFKVILNYRLAIFEKTLFSGKVDIAEGSKKDRNRDPSGSSDRKRVFYRSWERSYYRRDDNHWR